MIYITFNIQTILKFAFMALIAAPLPLLMLLTPLQYLNEKIRHRKYYSIVKKHFANPSLVSVEQLQNIFPNKKSSGIYQIAYYLQE